MRTKTLSVAGESQSLETPSTMPSTCSPFFELRLVPGRQLSIRSIIETNEEADKLMFKFFLWTDITFNIANNNPFYHSMFKFVAIVGPRYKGPPYDGFSFKRKKLIALNDWPSLGNHARSPNAPLC